MAGASDYLEVELLDHVLRQASYTSPSSVYIALFTADPTDANVTANECTDSTYARQNATGKFDSPHATGGYSANNAALTFPAITDGTITITHVGFYDSATAGNLLLSQALSADKTLAVNDVLSFGIGALKVTLS